MILDNATQKTSALYFIMLDNTHFFFSAIIFPSSTQYRILTKKYFQKKIFVGEIVSADLPNHYVFIYR